ncbi:MAG: response regulator [Deltaproteobacteria bacterium]|nr:response regulator [Myxococcales bacterium]MDP3220323.1 response regulator [Deltaproteobacteria bacterium]
MTTTDYKRLFEALPGLYLVLDPELTIVDASDDYLAATMTARDQIVGKGIFEVFPDNPDEAGATGVGNLRRSLDRVRSQRVTDSMALQRYDVRRADSGVFEERYWSPVNAPVLDGDQLRWIVHRVEDVTDFVRLKSRHAEMSRVSEELKGRTARAEADVYLRAQKIQEASAQVRSLNEELQAANRELLAQRHELELQGAELRAQQRELLLKNAEVERADRLKSEFLTNMSHELRTPLNSVIGFTELVLDEAPLGARHQKFLKDVLGSGRHLLALIGDILDLAQIESGRTRLVRETLDPGSVLDEVVDVARGQSLKRRITVRAEVHTGRAVDADPRKLRQILLNLVGNAVKFSPDGSTVTVSVDDRGPDLLFAVQDQGPGIDDALRPLLFTPFVQGETALVKKHQGTGLGLAITRKLVELHGGTVEAASASGAGARFTFTMPAAGPAAVSPTAPLVLLVGNGALDSLDVAPLLARAGYRTQMVASSEDALALTDSIRPAAVIVDAGMFSRDALALVDGIRRRPGLRDIPIVVTAAPQARFIAKPIDRADVLARLQSVIAPRSLVLSIDDDPVVGELLRSLLTPAGYRVSTALGGAEGLAAARSEPPDLIIVDLMMPDLSGFDVIDTLGRDARLRDVPVLVMTAADLTEAERLWLRERARAIAEKGSATADELIASVARATARARLTSAAGRARVLVADDNDLNRELARSILERLGHHVIEAADGADAIAAARRERPDLVLMDLAMPRVDGFEAIHTLSGDPATASIPIVALTSLAMRGDEERARSLGAVEYLTKPVDREKLEAVLARLLPRAIA